jgi:hypothetical protein
MTLSFTIPTTPPNTVATHYVDLSQVASIVNRRFYRQGINWAVSDFKFTSTAGSLGQIGIGKLPNTWVMSNAWEKAFRHWNKMNNEALESSPSVRPRFLDFKIYADSVHHNAGFGANLLPYAIGSSTASPGEWFSSKAVIPVAAGATEGAVNEFEFIAVGGNYPGASPATGLNAISLIEGYANSRSLPYQEDPNVPDDAADADNNTPENWIAAMFNDGTQQTDEVLDTMINQNNQAPYPYENDGTNLDTMYPGGENQLAGLQLHDQSLVTGTTIGGHTHLKGGNFPCGLIQITNVAAAEGTGLTLQMQISLVPGMHRGYECEPMTEM